MISRILGRQLYTVAQRTLRSLKSMVRISEEKFEVSINLQEYAINEIRVKAHNDYLIVEGKQEKETENGLMIRQFTKKFKLPPCNPKKIESSLSPDGVLTVTALRSGGDLEVCDIVEVPINSTSRLKEEKEVKDKKVYPPYCERYPKVKPKEIKPTE